MTNEQYLLVLIGIVVNIVTVILVKTKLVTVPTVTNKPLLIAVMIISITSFVFAALFK